MGPSGRSLNGGPRGRCSTPNLGDFGAPQYNTGRERYLAWGNERSIPLSKEEIEDIFLDLQQKQRPDIYGLLSCSEVSPRRYQFVGSKYDANLPVTRNIDLPPTLISHFDLLYVVLDEVNKALDWKPAQHLVSLYIEDNPETGGEDILVCVPIPSRPLPPCSYLGLTKKNENNSHWTSCLHTSPDLGPPASGEHAFIPQQIATINSHALTHLSEFDLLAPVGQSARMPSNIGPPPTEEEELEYTNAQMEPMPRQPIAPEPPLQR